MEEALKRRPRFRPVSETRGATIKLAILMAFLTVSSAWSQTAKFVQISPLYFATTMGGNNPLPQTFTLASTGAVLQVSGAPTVSPGGSGSWLSVSSCIDCETPAPITVTVNASSLPAGTYSGEIVFSAYNTSLTVPVTLTITNANVTSTLSVSPTSLSFSGTVGQPSPPAQTIAVSASGGAAVDFSAGVSASSGSWSVNASGPTPGTISVSTNTAGLSVGTYSATLTITSSAASNSPITVPLTLVVSNAQQAPVLSSIHPASGTAGTTLNVTLTGTGFASGSTVQVSNPGIAVTNVNVVSASQITAQFSIAASASGSANITVASPGGTSGSVSFAINPAPTGGTLIASPNTLSFTYQTGATAPDPQSLTISSTNGTLLSFAVSATTTDGGKWLIPGVNGGTTPEPFNVVVSPVGLANGNYSGTLTISSANVPSVVVKVSLTVSAPIPPQLSVQAPPLNLSGVQGGQAAVGQIQVSNPGAGILSFTASTQGGSWLSVSPVSGTVDNSVVGAGNAPPVSLAVTCNPSSLSPGIFQGSVTVVGAGSTVTLPVAFSVAAPAQSILLSQSAITFTAVSQAGAPLAKQLGVLNTGNGTLNWSAAVSTLSGGNWLLMSPTSGTVLTPYLDVSLASIAIDPAVLAVLAPGDYYGQIQITATAVNSPQLVTVYLSVLPAGSNPGPEINPASLIFTGPPGTSPAAQNVAVGITKAGSDQFVSGDIGKGFNYSPANSAVLPSQPVNVVVTPNFTSLLPGEIDRGTITLQFSDGTPRTISVLTVVAPGTTTNGLLTAAASTSCTNLNLQWRNPSPPSFSVIQGQGTSLELQIIDDCGNLIGPADPQAATVLATFSDGDANVPLVHIGNGVWAGTWTPQNSPSGSVGVNVTASNTSGSVLQSGQAASLTATVTPGTSPAVANGGVLQAASLVPGAPIAPGSLVSIFGSNLADPQGTNPTQVTLGNLTLPLSYTGAGQLNAQVPYNVPLNTQYQLRVQRGNVFSAPQKLVVAAAQPGIFTVDESGTGPGVILLSDGVTLAQGNNPPNVGDTVIIYCTGLGAVSPPVVAGVPPSGTTLSTTVNPATVTIAGINATVAYSGLAPGFPGLYQVNVVVPVGSDAGSSATVPVTMTVAGYTSTPVTIARPRPKGGTPGDKPHTSLKN